MSTKSVSKFEIKKTLLGKYQVLFDCPHCGVDLRADESEVLAEDWCPQCRMSFCVSPKAVKKIELDRKRILAEKQQRADKKKEKRREKQKMAVAARFQRKQEREAMVQEARESAEAIHKERVRNAAIGTGAVQQCPFCAEEIPAQAVRCKWCEADLRIQPHRCPECGALTQEVRRRKDNDQVGGWIMIVLGLVLAPMCIGIPMIIIGIGMLLGNKMHKECPVCHWRRAM